MKIQALHATKKDKESAKIIIIHQATAQCSVKRHQAFRVTNKGKDSAKMIIIHMVTVQYFAQKHQPLHVVKKDLKFVQNEGKDLTVRNVIAITLATAVQCSANPETDSIVQKKATRSAWIRLLTLTKTARKATIT